jgi:signal transduction histidine kinase
VDGTHAEQSLLAAAERKLARLRFDLHDGPQQDVHLLASELQSVREQVLPVIAGHPDAGRVIGRLDDLAARLIALDQDLRRLVTTLQSPFEPTAPLADALAELTGTFQEQTKIKAEVQLNGDLTRLSASQQIAVLALVREALSNVRKHSGASAVRISADEGAGAVHVRVSDDGKGFDPQAAIPREEASPHLGLIGMRERARMLGGETVIDSRPGGPTVISVSLPAWEPTGEAAARR